MIKPTRTVTLRLTETQLALVQGVLGQNEEAIQRASDELLKEVREAKHKAYMASLPYRDFTVERLQDAYLVHRVNIKARTKAEAFNILSSTENKEALFNLSEEGDVVVFDDVQYEVLDEEPVH